MSFFFESTQAFIRKTVAQDFARIRFLKLSAFQGRYRGVNYRITISISLNGDDCFAKVFNIFSHGKSTRATEFEDRVNQSLMLKPFVRDIAARPGLQKLRKEDMPELLSRISSAIQEALT